ncbi:MAG: sigma-70 family RNA polymerase sigma factor, partial [Chitinophagaceae bacterium]
EKETEIMNEDALSAIINAEVMTEINKEIGKLPRQCKRIFLLSYTEGFSNEQIAKLLGLSEHTVRNQKARAVALLRKRISKVKIFALISFFSTFWD